jgi:hypothetical protein
MSVYDFVGFLSGLTGLGLTVLGLLLTLLFGLRVLSVIHRPGKGRIARGIALGGLVLTLCGVALFFTAELSPFRRGVDRAAGRLGLLALSLAVTTGVWAGRRRSPRILPGAAPKDLLREGGHRTTPRPSAPPAAGDGPAFPPGQRPC